MDHVIDRQRLPWQDRSKSTQVTRITGQEQNRQSA
jgi:hypothetical protein